MKANTRVARNYKQFKELIELGGYVKMSISGEEAEKIIKNDTAATARAIVDEKLVTKKCPVTKKDATQTILFARSY